MRRRTSVARASVCLLATGVSLAAAGCDLSGGQGSAARYSLADNTPRRDAARCLRRAGFRVATDALPHAQADEPNDGVLTLARGRYSAEVAYYEGLARAKRLEPSLRRNAKRFHGLVYRIARATVIWTGPPSDAAQSDADNCLMRGAPD